VWAGIRLCRAEADGEDCPGGLARLATDGQIHVTARPLPPPAPDGGAAARPVPAGDLHESRRELQLPACGTSYVATYGTSHHVTGRRIERWAALRDDAARADWIVCLAARTGWGPDRLPLGSPAYPHPPPRPDGGPGSIPPGVSGSGVEGRDHLCVDPRPVPPRPAPRARPRSPTPQGPTGCHGGPRRLVRVGASSRSMLNVATRYGCREIGQIMQRPALWTLVVLRIRSNLDTNLPPPGSSASRTIGLCLSVRGL
jgi:hypothetical protein